MKRHIGRAMMWVPLIGVALFIGHQAGWQGSLIIVGGVVVICAWIMLGVSLWHDIPLRDMIHNLFTRDGP